MREGGWEGGEEATLQQQTIMWKVRAKEMRTHLCSGDRSNLREERYGEWMKVCWAAAFIPKRAFRS